MTEQLQNEQEQNKLFEDLKKEFLTKEGEEVFNKIKDIAVDTLKDLAKAKFYALLSGNEADKKLANESVKMISESLKDLTLAATDTATNYALEKLESYVSKIVFKELLKLIA